MRSHGRSPAATGRPLTTTTPPRLPLPPAAPAAGGGVDSVGCSYPLSSSGAPRCMIPSTCPLGFTMKKILIALLLSLSPAGAAELPASHEVCLKAKDYAGCVKSFTDTPPAFTTEKQYNECPPMYGYIGNSKCQSVACRVQLFGLGTNEPELGEKGHSCRKDNTIGRAVMKWGYNYAKASHNPACPNVELKRGERTTCGAN